MKDKLKRKPQPSQKVARSILFQMLMAKKELENMPIKSASVKRTIARLGVLDAI